MRISPRTSPGLDYLARAMRDVPVEALAVYLALENWLGLPRAAGNAAQNAALLPEAIFFGLVILVPLYTWRTGGVSGSGSYVTVIRATVFFVVWSLAMGTSVFLPPQGSLSILYDPIIVSFVFLAVFSLAGFLDVRTAEPDAPYAARPMATDGYVTRTAKFMPAEALALYLVVQNVAGFKSATTDQAAVSNLAFAVFVLAVASIPLVLWIAARGSGQSWIKQAAVSIAGFLVWVYAIGGRLDLPGLGQLADFHNGSMAAILLLGFTFGSGLMAPVALGPERPRLVVLGSYGIAVALIVAGMLLPFVAPQTVASLGLNVLTAPAISFVPLLGVAYVLHRRALVAVLKPVVPSVIAMAVVLYGLAHLALFDLAIEPAPGLIPAEGRMEGHPHDRQAAALWIDRDGAARLDRSTDTVTLARHGTHIRQAFLLAGGAEVLTVDRRGTTRIVKVHGAGWRAALDMPRLASTVRPRLWHRFGAPVARWALFVTSQVLALEIPERVQGRRGYAFRDCESCPEMVEIEPGHFLIGSPLTEAGRDSDESPRQLVTIERAFAVGRFAVTFDEWDACVAGGGCNGYRPEDRGWGRGRQPVINVSWDDAKGYVQWLSGRTGKTYRLLSEAEREFVTRAGTTSEFWWGASITPDQANYDGSSTIGPDGKRGELRNKPLVVDSFRPNPWGIYQVHGNVWEWVEDCYHRSGDRPASMVAGGRPWVTDCEKMNDRDLRVLRGGSWFSVPESLRSANRVRSHPDDRYLDIGFRVARTL